MDHYRTPLFTALMQHVANDPLQFHIPGHKKGRGADPEFWAFVGDNTLSIDLINIVPLDDLHQPTGAIREAEQLAADAFGADHTKAVLLINPTYYGTSIDLRQMVELVHSYNIPVLVDEAHGTLLHFHEQLPMSAMQAGTDMAATSIHKLGGSMTQSSILNVQGNRASIKRIRTVMSMLTTTSTSYLLLASLDTARRQLALHGQALTGQTIRLAQEARRQINEIPGLYCFGEEICEKRGVFRYDPTKLCIHLEQLNLTGYAAEQWLRETYKLEVELSDLTNILCLITLGDTEQEVNQLVQALRHLSDAFHGEGKCNKRVRAAVIPAASRFWLTPREAFYAPTEEAALEQACGRIISEFVYVYPPGIPILMPGQVITREVVDYIKRHVEAGLPVKGPEDPDIQKVKVVAAPRQQDRALGRRSGYIIPD